MNAPATAPAKFTSPEGIEWLREKWIHPAQGLVVFLRSGEVFTTDAYDRYVYEPRQSGCRIGCVQNGQVVSYSRGIVTADYVIVCSYADIRAEYLDPFRTQRRSDP